MKTINVKDEVLKAIRNEWPAFEQNHPHLAAAIDEDLLVEQAVEKLADDPEYQSAMAGAEVAGVAGAAVVDLIARFVGRWLRGG